MTQTSPSDTLRAAATRLRSPAFLGAATTTATVAALLRAREALADWLDETAALHEPQVCEKHEGCAPLGCDWCADEDWPCSDARHALIVARAILGDAR